jgi:hypothetical protein
MMEKVKFTYITRIICPKTQIHYLDAISGDGEHYVAEMSPHEEKWLVFISSWKKSGQVPYKNT